MIIVNRISSAGHGYALCDNWPQSITNIDFAAECGVDSSGFHVAA